MTLYNKLLYTIKKDPEMSNSFLEVNAALRVRCQNELYFVALLGYDTTDDLQTEWMQKTVLEYEEKNTALFVKYSRRNFTNNDLIIPKQYLYLFCINTNVH